VSYVEFSLPYESQIQDIQRLFKEIRKLSGILVHRLMNFNDFFGLGTFGVGFAVLRVEVETSYLQHNIGTKF
jgi:hypothetical protein